MIFCGDIALPYEGAIELRGIPSYLLKQKWVGNLEGTLVDVNGDEICELLKRHIVFNDSRAVAKLCKEIPFAAFNIANNHILNVNHIEKTIHTLNTLNIPCVGAGKNNREAEKELLLSEESEEYVILSFGWNAINCIYAGKCKEGVNPYKKDTVFRQIEKLKKKYPQKKIISSYKIILIENI